ncbi:MAG: hypothetical protein QXP22_00020 [Candidatus Anstonellales archaeon]
MQEKASWKGLLKIANITIGIKLFSVKEKEDNIHLLCKRHLLPIKYEKFCEKGEKLSKDEIVKAIKVNGNFKIIQDIKEKQEHIINVDKFSGTEPVFIKNTYIIKPDKGFEESIEDVKGLMLKRSIYGYGHFYMHNVYEDVCIKAFNEMEHQLILYIMHKKQRNMSYDETEKIANAISSLLHK